MDTSDPNIVFDANDECDYCRNFDAVISPAWPNDGTQLHVLMELAEKIKKSRGARQFDCIIGLSGGLDSSYAAYTAVRAMGLRPLLYHVDAGWNTDQAVGNIERLVEGLGLDLYTDVINWKEMSDLQRAFLRSQVADQDMPQDVAFFSSLYRFARSNGIRYILTGANFSTECCREPEEWGAYPGIDKRLICDIHRRFGERSLKTFPIVDIIRYKVVNRYLHGMTVVRPLNYVRYVKHEAEQLLGREFGWEPFEHKHHESRFTRFFEDFWLPRKFGFEKRRAHYSSLILTGQLRREDAIERLGRPIMSESFLEKEFAFVANKLGLGIEELRGIFTGPNKACLDYRNKRWLIGLGSRTLRRIGIERRLFR